MPIQASPNFNSLTTDTILGRDIVVNSRCSTPEQLEEDSDEDEEMTPVPKIMGLPSDIDDLFCGTQDDVINPVALHIFRRPKFFNSKASQYASSEATWTGMAEGQPNYQVNFEYGRRIHESTSYTDGGWGQRDNAKLMSPGFNTGGAAQISLGRPVNDQQTESMAYAALHAHGRHSFQDYIPDALEPVKGKQRSVDAADTFEMAASTLTQGGERGAAKSPLDEHPDIMTFLQDLRADMRRTYMEEPFVAYPAHVTVSEGSLLAARPHSAVKTDDRLKEDKSAFYHRLLSFAMGLAREEAATCRNTRNGEGPSRITLDQLRQRGA